MGKKRIAFISEHASPLATLGGVDSGGQNVYVAEVARHIAKLGYEVDIFTRRENKTVSFIVNWLPGIRVVHIKAGPVDETQKEDILPYMPEFRENMIRFMNEQNICYDLIHAHFFMSALVAMDLKERMGIPFVVTFHALGHVRRIHQGSKDRFPEERLFIEEEAVKHADILVAECPQDAEDLINLYNASPDRITTIPCGFNPKEFYPVKKSLARELLNIDPEEKVLLQLGRMVPRKGVDNVVKALAHIKTDKVRLIIVGGEGDKPDPKLCPEIGRLMEIAQQEGVSDKITFAGRKNRNKLKYYYSAADLFITTPWYEPFGITPLESMACGTPVIGSDVGGIKFSIKDGETGYLVPANDPVALATKATKLLTNDDLMQKMKRNALLRVNREFTWSCVADSLHQIYEELLSRHILPLEIPVRKKAA